MYVRMHTFPSVHIEADTWADYVKQHAPGQTQGQIAALAGISQSTVNRWLSGSIQPTASAVVAFARAYHRPPVEALIAAGVLSPAEGVA